MKSFWERANLGHFVLLCNLGFPLYMKESFFFIATKINTVSISTVTNEKRYASLDDDDYNAIML